MTVVSGRAELVSVVVPTRNGGQQFEETLDAVLAQEAPFRIELLVVDSGSTDGTAERAEKRGVRVLRIDPASFDHGSTRQWGAEQTPGDHVAFLTQDATPADRFWLAELVAALDADPSVAGAYSRQLPRPEADPIAAADLRGWLTGSAEPRSRRIDSRADYDALSPWQRRLFANFDDVSSCIRRSALSAIPFEPTPFGEDLAWSRRALEAGWTIAYVPTSRVVHSHRTTVVGKYRRALQDHRAMRAVFGLDYFDEVFGSSWEELAKGVFDGARENLATVRAARPRFFARLRWSVVGALSEVAEGLAYVKASREAPPPAVDSGRRRLLVVAHDFPPEQAGGTAVYADRVARELAKRHEVTVFHRSTDEARPDYDVVRTRRDGLRVVSMNLPPRGTKAAILGLEDARAERIFDAVVAESRAEVVHFEYLGSGIAASFLEIAKRRGAATVVTLQDYWGICPRGQMMSFEWELCARAVPSRCSACVTGTYMPVSTLLARQESSLDLASREALARAEVDAPPGCVDAAAVSIEAIQRRWLVAHPPATVRYRFRLGGGARLRFQLGTAPDTWSRPGGGVLFRVRAAGSAEPLFERYLDPKSRPEDRAWIAGEVELADEGERELDLLFETAAGPSGDSSFCTAGWGELELGATGGGRVELLEVAPRPASLGGELLAAASRWRSGAFQVSAREIEARTSSILGALAGAGRVIAPSAYLGEMFVEHGLDRSKIVVSDYGFEPGRRRTSTGSRRIVFGYLGTWMATKGLHVLVDAFLGLPEGAAELRLHGYSPNANHDEYVRWMVDRIGTRPDVRLMGRYEPERVAEILDGIDVLVVPSIWHENSPLTIHEAFVAGVPVVTSDQGGMAELVEHEVSGLRYPIGDVGALRRALERFVAEPDLAARLARGVPRVKTVAENALELERLYDELAPLGWSGSAEPAGAT